MSIAEYIVLATKEDGSHTATASLEAYGEVYIGYMFNMMIDGIFAGVYEVTQVLQVNPITTH